jgi:hypothetical protein
MAEWTFLWLQKQHLYGIEKTEAVRYMLEGAAARSDTVTAVTIIEESLSTTKIQLGEKNSGVDPTAGYVRSMTENDAEVQVQIELKRQNSFTLIHKDEGKLTALNAAYEQLEIAKEIALHHKTLVFIIIAIIIIIILILIL